MKKNYIIIICLFVLLSSVQCTTKHKPEEVSSSFIEYMSKFEFNKAAGLCTKSTKEAIESWKFVTDFIASGLKTSDLSEQMKEYTLEFIDCEIHNDSSLCKYLVNGEEILITLKKENNQWKVDIPSIPNLKYILSVIHSNLSEIVRSFGSLLEFGLSKMVEKLSGFFSEEWEKHHEVITDSLIEFQANFVFDNSIIRTEPETVIRDFYNYVLLDDYYMFAQYLADDFRDVYVLTMFFIKAINEDEVYEEFNIESVTCKKEINTMRCEVQHFDKSISQFILIKQNQHWLINDLE